MTPDELRQHREARLQLIERTRADAVAAGNESLAAELRRRHTELSVAMAQARTRRGLEDKIADWQGRAVHAERELRQAALAKRQTDAEFWDGKRAVARATLDALYEMLSEVAS